MANIPERLAVKPAPSLPLYERLRLHNPDDTKIVEQYMTVDELVEQTHAFMRRYAAIPAEKRPSTIFFLDKGARPIARIFRQLHDVYNPGEEMPAMKFVNVGRGGGVTQETPTGDSQAIHDTYAPYMDTRGRILILDDFEDSGKTLDNAKKLLGDAFPDAELVGDLSDYDRQPQRTVYSKIPAWSLSGPEGAEYTGVKEATLYDTWEASLAKVNEVARRDWSRQHNGSLKGFTPIKAPYQLYKLGSDLKTIIYDYRELWHRTMKDMENARRPWQKVATRRALTPTIAREELTHMCEEIVSRLAA